MAGLAGAGCTASAMGNGPRGQSVTFVVGMRGAATPAAAYLKEHLIRVLFLLAARLTEAVFNVIAFSSKVLKWCNCLVRCSLCSVTEAAAWIRSLHFENGMDAASGLAVAFEDPDCEEVYLLTNMLPEQESEEICQLLAENKLHPVHVVCLLGDSDDYERGKQKTMEKVARQSGGSFQVIRLPHTASEKKSILNSASEEKQKEVDFNEVKIEHKRQQEEQRQLKREQQQKADGVRRQLLRDNQRQRLLQRTLQGLEKQQEHKDRTFQHIALLQAAIAERSRKESSLLEEDRRKASQRLQFLKTQHLEREAFLAEHNERSFEQEKDRLDLLRSRIQSQQEIWEQESQEQDRQQKQHHAAKRRVFQSRDHSHQKREEEGQKHCDLQQYLRDQNLLMLRTSLLE
nr:putative cyclin-dependent serine/threonine-protein kinase DDB_G0272797/DDB_G0274007 [Dromaius novaehollandiae]